MKNQSLIILLIKPFASSIVANRLGQKVSRWLWRRLFFFFFRSWLNNAVITQCLRQHQTSQAGAQTPKAFNSFFWPEQKEKHINLPKRFLTQEQVQPQRTVLMFSLHLIENVYLLTIIGQAFRSTRNQRWQLNWGHEITYQISGQTEQFCQCHKPSIVSLPNISTASHSKV